MNAIVLAGHGKFPEGIRQTVEMIIGNVEHLYCINLLPEEGKDEFFAKLDRLNDSELVKFERIVFLVDLIGGTPSNCLFERYEDNDKVDIIGGINLLTVIRTILGTYDIQSIISEGRGSLQSVKEFTPNDTSDNLVSNSDEDVIEKEIVNVRVDYRGIHGQVATSWIPKLKVNRIMVIHDDIVKDDVQKMALKMAKPNNTKLSIVSTDYAAERLQNNKYYSNERIMIVFRQIKMLERLISKGISFKEVNLGNIPNREGTEKITKTVYLNSEEKNVLKKLHDLGTNIIYQMVPSDNVVKIDNKLF